MQTSRSGWRFTRVVVGALMCAAFRWGMADPAVSTGAQWPDGTPQQIREDIFGLRFRMVRELDGAKAGLAFLTHQFERNPRPEVKAYLGWICLFSDGWGYPQMHDEARGLKLVSEAREEGSVVGCDVLARAKGYNMGGPAKPEDVVALLREAAAGGSTRSMARLGYYYAVGNGVPANLVEAETWTTRAAQLGQPIGWFEIGSAYEQGAIRGRVDMGTAMVYYYRAATCCDDDADKRLSELAKQGVAEAEVYRQTGLLHWANVSSWTPPSRVKQYVTYLKEHAGDNGPALLELGVAHLGGKYASRDYDLARDYLNRAMRRGEASARVYLFKMKFEGRGEPEQPQALAEIEAMADIGVPEAATYIGFINYWGSKEARIKRDPAKAFKYSRLAAEKGDPTALVNLAYCYESGIGTPKNYALAAKVYWLAYLQGYTPGRDRVRSLLPFVK